MNYPKISVNFVMISHCTHLLQLLSKNVLSAIRQQCNVITEQANVK